MLLSKTKLRYLGPPTIMNVTAHAAELCCLSGIFNKNDANVSLECTRVQFKYVEIVLFFQLFQ